jgi:iron-sulfur cluster repair protein YtfE (RIC family)
MRVAYYQKKASRIFAISYGFEIMKRSFIKKTAKKRAVDLIKKLNNDYLKQDIVNRLSPQLNDQEIHQTLYSNIGETILNRFKKEYEEHFDRLIMEVKKIQSK